MQGAVEGVRAPRRGWRTTRAIAGDAAHGAAFLPAEADALPAMAVGVTFQHRERARC